MTPVAGTPKMAPKVTRGVTLGKMVDRAKVSGAFAPKMTHAHGSGRRSTPQTLLRILDGLPERIDHNLCGWHFKNALKLDSFPKGGSQLDKNSSIAGTNFKMQHLPARVVRDIV
jgi:hypothetical protein